MSNVISIPFQEKVTVRIRDGKSENGVITTTELRPHPFFAGSENYVICSAVYDVIRDIPNPFTMFFCAPTGYGKTHLMEGLFISWLAQHAEKSGRLISAQEFSREWVATQRTRMPQEFFRKYHHLDFFVLEDLQAIATHTSTQEQLVQTLDSLARRNARIFLTANQSLSTMLLNPKLVSRLQQGVSIEIAPPTQETREAILQFEATAKQIAISEQALQDFATLASQEELSVGDMLIRFQKMEWIRKTRREEIIQEPVVAQIFSDENSTEKVSIAQIAKLAAKYYKIRLADLRSKSRKTTLVTVRDIVYYIARRYTDATLDEIGVYFNGRDHTTVLHGINQAKMLLLNDEEVRECVQFLISELHLAHNNTLGKHSD